MSFYIIIGIEVRFFNNVSSLRAEKKQSTIAVLLNLFATNAMIE